MSKLYDFQINHTLDYTEQIFREAVNSKFSSEDVDGIIRALGLAKEFHADQVRADGSPYAVHPIRVALLALEYNDPTADVLITALLHDVLEETTMTESEVISHFGNDILAHVRDVTGCKSNYENEEDRRQRKLRHWQRIMAGNEVVRKVKVFDNLDNMISWKFIDSKSPNIRKISRWLMQAQEMFLPLAKITNEQAYQASASELEFYLKQGHKPGTWYSDPTTPS